MLNKNTQKITKNSGQRSDYSFNVFQGLDFFDDYITQKITKMCVLGLITEHYTEQEVDPFNPSVMQELADLITD